MRKPQAEVIGKYVDDSTGQTICHRIVWLARKIGILHKLKIGLISCTDCGGPALHYEHRNYNYPLHVVPVCKDCNRTRGKAIPAEVERRLTLITVADEIEKIIDDKPCWQDFKIGRRKGGNDGRGRSLEYTREELAVLRKSLDVIGMEIIYTRNPVTKT